MLDQPASEKHHITIPYWAKLHIGIPADKDNKNIHYNENRHNKVHTLEYTPRKEGRGKI
jgi:hypothetical protein